MFHSKNETKSGCFLTKSRRIVDRTRKPCRPKDQQKSNMQDIHIQTIATILIDCKIKGRIT